MTSLTEEEAEEAVARYGPDDVAQALAHAARHGADPVWLAALQRHPAGGGGDNARRSHRRGRRG